MTFTLARSSPVSSNLTEAYSTTLLHIFCSSVASCSSYLIKREEARVECS
jgi:hypothetical protein